MNKDFKSEDWDVVDGIVNGFISVMGKPNKDGYYQEYIHEDEFNNLKKAIKSHLQSEIDKARSEVYKNVGSWYKVPIRTETIKLEVPAGIDKDMPEGGFVDMKGCGTCGGELVYIRGRHPGADNRRVCPTCAIEILESILSNCNNREVGTELSITKSK